MLQAKVKMLPVKAKTPTRKPSLFRRLTKRLTRKITIEPNGESEPEPETEPETEPEPAPARKPLRRNRSLTKQLTRGLSVFTKVDDVESSPKPQFQTGPIHEFVEEKFPGAAKLEEHQVYIYSPA